MDRKALIPVGDGAGEALERVLEAFSASGVGLAECLDTDSVALCASDLHYFPKDYFGRVPSYAKFMNYVNQLPLDQRNRFKEMVAEIESGRSLGEMNRIASKTDGNASDARIFNMYKSINNVAERRLDRIGRSIDRQGEAEARGVDMAARLITALSNADLLRIKDTVDTIDAEYREADKEGADGEA